MKNTYLISLIALFVSLGFPIQSNAQTDALDQIKITKIDELIAKYTEFGKFNGSVLVAEEGKVLYKKGFGLANMEWDIPNQPNTKFRLASITKQFTAMLILQLAAENKLDLDKPISNYLPDYPKKNGDQITTHHLLTHTSGTPNHTSFSNYRKIMRKYHSPEDLVELFADMELNFIPGEKFEYSNSGYTLLGIIIEKLTGKSYEQVLHDKIFSPLQMTNSGYDNYRTVLKNRATGYNNSFGEFRNAQFLDMSIPYAAGSIYSTVEDLFLWDRALYTNELLPAKFMKLYFNKHVEAFAQYYSYGWEIGKISMGNTKDQSHSIGHSGGINGFNTKITRFPTNQSSIILLNNTSGAPLREMTVAINGILNNKTYDFPKKSIAKTILVTMKKEGISKALEIYKSIRESSSYHLDEHEMNMSGYQLLQSDKIDEALAIFKLNVEAFPNSFNVYDSYGEALLVKGKKAEGIESYKKSIQLNPKNKGGIKILKDLGINTDNLIVKVSIESLKLLEGTYRVTDRPDKSNKKWTITMTIINGTLHGNDRGYEYELVPIGNDQFVNPDDGEVLKFDMKNREAISFILFKKYTFTKV